MLNDISRIQDADQEYDSAQKPFIAGSKMCILSVMSQSKEWTTRRSENESTLLWTHRNCTCSSLPGIFPKSYSNVEHAGIMNNHDHTIRQTHSPSVHDKSSIRGQSIRWISLHWSSYEWARGHTSRWPPSLTAVYSSKSILLSVFFWNSPISK